MKSIRIARARLKLQRLVCQRSVQMIADNMTVDLIPSTRLVLVTTRDGLQEILPVDEFATMEPNTIIRPEDLGADPKGPGRPRKAKPKKAKKPPKKPESSPRLPTGPKPMGAEK